MAHCVCVDGGGRERGGKGGKVRHRFQISSLANARAERQVRQTPLIDTTKEYFFYRNMCPFVRTHTKRKLLLRPLPRARRDKRR